MDELNEVGEPQRSLGARVGIAALNILTPGLGLLRLGRLRLGLGFAFAGFALVLVLAGAGAVLPELTPTGLLAVIGLIAIMLPILYLAPVVLGWKESRLKSGRLAWWAKWYGLLGIAAVVSLGSNLALDLVHGIYRPFYIPAESMEPTLSVGERFVADMRDKSLPKRGDIILLNVVGQIYVKRVAALPGDRISMRGGIPVVNGMPAIQRRLGMTVVDDFTGTLPAQILVERLPGEAGEHRVLDLGENSRVDEMTETTVPPGHLFVLGDHRDRSADSRVSRAEGGVEMLPVGEVVGRPLFKTWTKWRWLGTSIH